MSENRLLSKIIMNLEEKSDKVAIFYKDRAYTFNDLLNGINGYRDILFKLEISRKSRIILKIEDNVEFIQILIAIWLLDCIPIPLSCKTGTKEFSNAVKESKANVIITNDTCHQLIKERNFIDKHLFYGKTSYANEECVEECAIFFYTTGTTGNPKCVMFSEEAFFYNISDLAEAIQLSEKDTLYTPLSLDLTASLTTAALPSLLIGSTLVLSSKQLPRSIFNIIEKYKVSVFFAVPYIYELLVEGMASTGEWKTNNLRLCLSSSAYLSKTLKASFKGMTGIWIRSIYCSSEAGVISYNDANDEENNMDSVGKCMGDTNVYLLSDDLSDSNRNIGEIYVKGRHIAKGYFNRPDLQKEVFTVNGVKTGDIGVINEEGYIQLLGREACTINVGGHLIYPDEIEEVIKEIEGIEEALVYGIKDTAIGEVAAVKVVSVNKACTSKEIISHCMSRLSSYKIPRKIEFVDKIEKGNYGKKKRAFIER